MITDEKKLKEVFDKFSKMAISQVDCLEITKCENLKEFLIEYYSRGYKMPSELTPEERAKKIESLVGIFPMGSVENT